MKKHETKNRRMIYMADAILFNKIKELRSKYSLNVSALIRQFLEKTYEEYTNKEKI